MQLSHVQEVFPPRSRSPRTRVWALNHAALLSPFLFSKEKGWVYCSERNIYIYIAIILKLFMMMVEHSCKMRWPAIVGPLLRTTVRCELITAFIGCYQFAQHMIAERLLRIVSNAGFSAFRQLPNGSGASNCMT